MHIKDLLLSAKSIAIVGLSPSQDKPSHQVGAYLQSRGYHLYPIYPKPGIILGERAYQEIWQIQENIDIFVIFRRSEKCLEITQEILSLQTPKAIWLQLGISNEAAKAEAQKRGVCFIQNRCIKIEREKYD